MGEISRMVCSDGQNYLMMVDGVNQHRVVALLTCLSDSLLSEIRMSEHQDVIISDQN